MSDEKNLNDGLNDAKDGEKKAADKADDFVNEAKEKAKELAKLGAEVVAADIDDPASVDKALEGAYGAYFVTFFCNDSLFINYC